MATYIITDFSAGEVSDRLLGRIDLPFYRKSCRRIRNFYVLPQGVAEKRPGTLFCGMVKNAQKKVRLVPFSTGPNSGIVFEFGHEYIRAYKDGAVVKSGENIVEAVTTYTEADLFDFCFAQNGPYLYIAHKNYKLQRVDYVSDDSWSIGDVSFIYTDGAGNPENVLALDFETDNTDLPGICTFYESRMILASSSKNPTTVWASRQGLVEDFGNTAQPTTEEAWVKNLDSAGKAGEILWAIGGDRLVFGTPAGPWVAGDDTNMLTPTTPWWPRRQAEIGSAATAPVMIDDIIAFVQRGRRKVRQMEYSRDHDKSLVNDLTIMSEHITGPGVIALAHQEEPEATLYALRSDGRIAAMAYSRQAGVMAWSILDFGGTVESIATVAGESEDEVYIAVNRGEERFIERLGRRRTEAVEDYRFLDSGVYASAGHRRVTYQIYNENPARAVLPDHAFTNGQTVRVVGEDDPVFHDAVFVVGDVTAHQFCLYHKDGGDPLDLSALPGNLAEAIVEPVMQRFTGLSHLNAQNNVEAYADGGSIGPVEVISGEIETERYFNYIYVGIHYRAVLEPFPLADGQGKTKRITQAFIRFVKTVGAKVGPHEDALETIDFKEVGFPMDSPDPVFTGAKRIQFQGNFDFDGDLVIVHEDPYPCTVSFIACDVEVGK